MIDSWNRAPRPGAARPDPAPAVTASTEAPAALLRRAASLMRERAGKATDGPWRYFPDRHWRRPGSSEWEESVFVGPPGKQAISVARTGDSDDPQSMTDAAFIASWHPGVALAVADWLEAYAERFATWAGPHIPEELGLALAVARAYLGEG